MEYKRYLEAEFILICHDLYGIHNNIMDVLYFIEALCQLDDFSELRMKRLVQTAFTDARMPMTREWVKILLETGHSIQDIMHWTGYARQTIYNIKNKKSDCVLPVHYMYNLTEKDYNNIEKFIKLIHIFQGVGLSHERSKERPII